MVEKAILRQIEKVKELAPDTKGYKYLFREIKSDNRGKGKIILDSNGVKVVDSIPYDMFSGNVIFLKIFKEIPLKILMVLYIKLQHINLGIPSQRK